MVAFHALQLQKSISMPLVSQPVQHAVYVPFFDCFCNLFGKIGFGLHLLFKQVF